MSVSSFLTHRAPHQIDCSSAMASTTESSLLSKLQSNDLTNIHALFSNYLRPFHTLLAVNNNPQNSSKTLTSDIQTSTIRSLAKQFLPFINSALKLLPTRLAEKPQIDATAASELFDAYNLCLNCLDSVLSQLACKPYSVQLQKVRLLRCLEACGRYKEAESEGFLVLSSLRCINIDGTRNSGCLKECKGRILPDLGKGSVDNDFVLLVVEISLTIVKSASMNKSNNQDEYRRTLALVEELKPWFRVLDATNYEKLHRILVACLKQCTLNSVGDLPRFSGNLARDFCVAMFSEFAKSSTNDEMAKFARKICCCLFSQINIQSQFNTEILICVLDSLAGECKVGVENTIQEFLELVCYCANKCRVVTARSCCDLAKHLNKLANEFHQVFSPPINLIMDLYAAGLYISHFPNQFKWGETTTLKTSNLIKYLLENKDGLLNLTDLLSLNNQYNISEKLAFIKSSCTELKGDDSSRQPDKYPYLVSYFNALRYFCQPLAEFFNSERRELLAEIENVSFSTKLFPIQDTLHQLCNVFLFAHRTCVADRDALDASHKILPTIAVAVFTLSFLTKRNVKGIVNLVKHIISSEWIQINELAYLFSSLYNTGLVLYRNNKMNEASRAVKLSCQAAWTRISQMCKKVLNKSKRSDAGFSQDCILGFVVEACDKSSFLVDVLYQCGSHKVDAIISDSLEKWSFAETIIKDLPNPKALVKQWVKIKIKLFKDTDAENSNVTLYSLLSSSVIVCKKTLGILLELELQAYKERTSLNPKLCQRMQMNIIDILLEDVYVKKDSCLQKSRVLIAKARALRGLGAESVNGCVQCLSDAISIVIDADTIEARHLLAEAYCLRALSTQEIEPNSERILKDIHAAFVSWSTPQHIHAPDHTETMFALLYHIIDLLSLKGFTECHSVIYEMMIRLYNLKHIKLEKLVTTLWEYRRLAHALCTLPVNEAFIVTLAHHCGVYSKSTEFWLNCMNGSPSLKLGFQWNFESSFGPNITSAEVRQAASDLISSVPIPRRSAFLAAYLYYDLCESLTANGQLIQALSCAKESHRLRSTLFQEKFAYSMEQQSEVYGEEGEKVQKHFYFIKNFEVSNSAAMSAWPCDDITFDVECGILTPWKVLQCLLESTLQVASIQEKLGNGSEAEILLTWGKSISTYQGLALFTVAFSSILGKIYQKQLLWNLAQTELENAKQILNDNANIISCFKCRIFLEVTIDQQLGDLSRTLDSSKEKLVFAEKIYISALSKLHYSDKRDLADKIDTEETNRDVKKTRKTRLTTIPTIRTEKSSRTTRSRNRAAGKVSDCITNHELDGYKGPDSEIREDSTCCNTHDFKENAKLNDFVSMKWEFVRRRLIIRLLTSRGKCLGLLGEIHKAHEIFRESICVMISKCPFCPSTQSSVSFDVVLDLIEKDISGGLFAVEKAVLFYNICWFSLENYFSNSTRADCCNLSRISVPRIIGCLKFAFVLCREVPYLLQKVSKLLAVIYLLSTSMKSFALPKSACKTISENEWASYFHQASIGNHHNNQLFSGVIDKKNAQNLFDLESSCLSTSTFTSQETLDSFRLASDSIQSLEEFVKKFFQKLPNANIICISILGNSYNKLLQKLSISPSSTIHAWILLSRLNSNGQPIVVLLPIGSILEETSEDDIVLFQYENAEECSGKKWECPWGSSTLIDELAPNFRVILEENYVSSATFPIEDTKEIRSSWWRQRKTLDRRLGKFLRDLEDSWFGPWKFLLLGDYSDSKNLDLIQKEIADSLKNKYKIKVPESVLKVVIGGIIYGSQREECAVQIVLNNGCYIGQSGDSNYQISKLKLSGKFDGIESLSQSIFKSILETAGEVEEGEPANREPIILVLDFDIQMLPWENLPILRNQEVYRMPSVGCISATLQRSKHFQDSLRFLPLIDPLDAYYLLNPSGDLSSTQIQFQSWFTNQNLEGKTGATPTIQELSIALKSHDLFIYLGHGSGSQYIPRHEIQKLERCAATLLMGCSSGSLSLNGSYTPQGTPLSYLLAGSPIIIANLWEVTDKDIDRFGKSMLDSWLRERSDSSSSVCDQCELLSSKLENLNINGGKGNGRIKNSKKKISESCESNTHICMHRRKIGSFMQSARDACLLPFLIGAAPVCYGVPTGIQKKDKVSR